MKGFFYLASFECPIGCPPTPSENSDLTGDQSPTIIKEIVRNLDKNGYSLQIPKRSKPPGQCGTIDIDGKLFVILVDLETTGQDANQYSLKAWSVAKGRNREEGGPDSDEQRLARAFSLVLDEQLRKTVVSFGGRILPG